MNLQRCEGTMVGLYCTVSTKYMYIKQHKFPLRTQKYNLRLLLLTVISCNFCTTTVHTVHLAISALQQYTLYILQFLHYNSTRCTSCNFCITTVHPVNLAIAALQQYTCTKNSSYTPRSHFITLITITLNVLTHLQ
jgi:hypothetical protein